MRLPHSAVPIGWRTIRGGRAVRAVFLITAFLLAGVLLPLAARDIPFDRFNLVFSYPDTYNLKIVEKNATRIILDSHDARVGITIIHENVPRALDDYVLEILKEELKGKGYGRVNFTSRETVLLPFRNFRETGSAFRAKYELSGRPVTSYIYIFSSGDATFLITLTDKMGSTNTFDFFLETFRIKKEKPAKNNR